jgi:hypothetical protein
MLGVLLVGVPGSVALVVLPPWVRPTTRFALVFGTGYAISATVAWVLALAGRLETGALVAALAASTVVGWALALRFGSVRDLLRSFRTQVEAEPGMLLLGFGVIVAITFSLAAIDPIANIPAVSPFHYYNDALEVADVGRFPDLSLQYGRLYPPANSKAVLNSFNAALIVLAGRDPIPVLGTLVWLGSVGTGAALWAVARELGLRYTAPLLPLLAVANKLWLNVEFALDQESYRAENYGRLVALCVLALAIAVIRQRRGWAAAVAAGLLAGVAASTHLIALTVAVIAGAWYLVARLIVDRHVWPVMARVAVMGLLGLVTAGIFLFATPGDVAFEGVGSTGSYTPGEAGVDLTRYLYTSRLRAAESRPSAGEVATTFVAAATSTERARAPSSSARPLWLLGGGLALAVAILAWFPRHLKHIGLMSWGLGVALVGLSVLLALRSDVFIFTTFGVRRLVDYGSLPIILVALGALELGLWWIARFNVWAAMVAAAVVVTVTASILLPGASRVRDSSGVAQGRRAVQLLGWVRANTPCDARILTNQRTIGVYKAFTGRLALIEGMSPYLRPEMLRRVSRLLLDARDFYRSPDPRFLERHGIDYVIRTRNIRLGYPYGATRGNRAWSRPYLKRMLITDEVQAFEVALRHQRRRADFGTLPGYECRSAR